MMKVQSKEKYKTTLGTIFMVKINQGIAVGDYIIDENNEKFEVIGIQMPTQPSLVDLTGLIVKPII